MSKAITLTKIEHEIETLPQADQTKLFNWLGNIIKKAKSDKSGRTGITEQINKVYATESSDLDRRLLNAQLASLEREEW